MFNSSTKILSLVTLISSIALAIVAMFVFKDAGSASTFFVVGASAASGSQAVKNFTQGKNDAGI